jgi:hypothetical protein
MIGKQIVGFEFYNIILVMVFYYALTSNKFRGEEKRKKVEA